VGLAALQTLAVSLLGTAIPVLLGGVLALPAAGRLGRAPQWLARLALNALRSVPELVWAALMVLAAGLGPFAGTLALALHTTGVLGRLFAESLENASPAPEAALRDLGAGRIARFGYGTLPLIAPQCIGYTLYRWEMNIRMATILGFVGGGGLGQMLYFHLSLFQQAQAATVLLAMFVLVVGVDAASAYVRRGLDSEWIASWNTQSLRAGSIAYRSYGASRVAHPINANFDICSSACCQVNDAGTSSSTDTAIARTPGLMLTRGGSEAASAEYSAENNSWDDPGDGLACSNVDLSCGNGYAGSPSVGWPCLTDTVGASHGCFGHGRGMSQWGTQRWAIDASARRWPWIVDHYYNDNNNATGAGSGQRTAVMTSPLDVSAATPQPASIAPGATVRIGATATNHAGATHAHLLIGASLYRSGVGYVDDPAHDTALSLATGGHAIARDFHTPPTLAPGSYDVLLSLYLDADEDGAISTADLPLALVTSAHALQVIDDRIFASGFEPTP